MTQAKHISVREFCTYHKVEEKFILSLNDYGLIKLTSVENVECIDHGQISDIEQLMRLHFELNINMEGLGAVAHLLQKIRTLREDVITLQNKLERYQHADDYQQK